MFFSAAASAARSRLRDEHRLRRRPLLGRHLAGEAVDLAAADRRDVVERLLEQRGEFLLAARHGGDAELARRCLPGAVLMPSMVRPWRSSSAFTADGAMVIGKLQLDRA